MGLTSTRFPDEVQLLNDPTSDIMDNRWRNILLLNKMAIKLRSEFPDHRLEAAKTALIDMNYSEEVNYE